MAILFRRHIIAIILVNGEFVVFRNKSIELHWGHVWFYLLTGSIRFEQTLISEHLLRFTQELFSLKHIKNKIFFIHL